MPWLSSRLSDRTGRLHGAVVVRTPDDALKDTNVRIDFKPQPVRDAQPPKPRRPAPASPPAPTTPVEHPPISPDSTLMLLSTPIPPFSPILVSPPPGSVSHLSSAIVILETCTTTYKSTLTTLCSQPSFLADYLNSLAKPRISTSSSVYSSESTDLDGNRPVSQGPLGSTSCSASFHIFLDRSSSPYAHILAFLRTQSVSSECPPTLPHGVQLTSHARSTSSSLFNAKLEALLELRDETAYIGLDSLHKLCTDEIRQRLFGHARGSSASVNVMTSPGSFPSLTTGIGSIQSYHASVHSLHTLIEKSEGDSTVCADKSALKLVSSRSENTEQDDKSPISPLGFPAPPLPTPTIPIAPAPILKPVSPKSTQTQSSPPRHVRSPSSRPSTATAGSAIPTMKQLPSLFTSSPYTPPSSANSSPSQLYTSPPSLYHKKAESTSIPPSPAPLPPSQHVTLPVVTGDGGLKIRGRVVTSHLHRPSPSVSTSLPGWI